MDKNRLLELFKKAKIDKVENNQSKAELRRKLLNSDKFGRRSILQNILNLKFALRIAAIITVIIILITTDFTPREISAMDILNKIDAVYSKSIKPGKINYAEGVCTVFGENEKVINFKFENWHDPNKNKTKFIRRDIKTGEILDLKIVDGLKVFKSPGAKIKIIKMEKIEEIPDHQSIKKIVSRTLNLQVNPENFDQEYRVKADTNISSNTHILFLKKFDQSIPVDTSEPKILIFSRFFDVDEMNMETPKDIINRFKSQSNVVYLGAKYDEKIGKKVLLLQKATKLDSNQSISIGISRDCDLFSQVTISQKENRYSKDKRIKTFTYTISDDPKPKTSIEKRETIKINSETGKIYEVNVTVMKNGKEENISNLTWQNEKMLDYDNSIFDKKIEGVIILRKEKK